MKPIYLEGVGAHWVGEAVLVGRAAVEGLRPLRVLVVHPADVNGGRGVNSKHAGVTRSQVIMMCGSRRQAATRVTAIITLRLAFQLMHLLVRSIFTSGQNKRSGCSSAGAWHAAWEVRDQLSSISPGNAEAASVGDLVVTRRDVAEGQTLV